MRSRDDDALDAALGALAGERWRALVAYAYLLEGSLAAAEDLVQDALVKTLVRRGAVAPGAIESFARRAILTTFVDGHRRRRRFAAVRHLLARADDDASHEHSAAARQDVQTVLLRLPPQQRACVVLRFYDDLTTAEIADRLGLGEGTVKRYLSLASRRLRTDLDVPTDDDRIDVVAIEKRSRP